MDSQVKQRRIKRPLEVIGPPVKTRLVSEDSTQFFVVQIAVQCIVHKNRVKEV